MQEFGKQAVNIFQAAAREHPSPPPGSAAAETAAQSRPQSFDQAFNAFGGAQSFEELEALGEPRSQREYRLDTCLKQ